MSSSKVDFFYTHNPANYDPRNDYDFLTDANRKGYFKLSDIPNTAMIQVYHDNKTRIISPSQFYSEVALFQSYKEPGLMEKASSLVDELKFNCEHVLCKLNSISQDPNYHKLHKVDRDTIESFKYRVEEKIIPKVHLRY